MFLCQNINIRSLRRHVILYNNELLADDVLYATHCGAIFSYDLLFVQTNVYVRRIK